MAEAINLEKLKKDMDRWPKSWAGFDSDIPTGTEIVEVMHEPLLDGDGGGSARLYHD